MNPKWEVLGDADCDNHGLIPWERGALPPDGFLYFWLFYCSAKQVEYTSCYSSGCLLLTSAELQIPADGFKAFVPRRANQRVQRYDVESVMGLSQVGLFQSGGVLPAAGLDQ